MQWVMQSTATLSVYHCPLSQSQVNSTNMSTGDRPSSPQSFWASYVSASVRLLAGTVVLVWKTNFSMKCVAGHIEPYKFYGNPSNIHGDVLLRPNKCWAAVASSHDEGKGKWKDVDVCNQLGESGFLPGSELGFEGWLHTAVRTKGPCTVRAGWYRLCKKKKKKNLSIFQSAIPWMATVQFWNQGWAAPMHPGLK